MAELTNASFEENGLWNRSVQFLLCKTILSNICLTKKN